MDIQKMKNLKPLLSLFLLFFIITSAFAQNALKILRKTDNGVLCEKEGKKVLFIEGSPAEMGKAHGSLLSTEIKDMSDKIFLMAAQYTVMKNTWFFEKINEVGKRTSKFMPEKYYEECDAMSKAAGITISEGRNMNLFPEMFHCSGLAVRNKATKDGRIYHVRVLDYMTEIGLQDNAVVMVFTPGQKDFRWISVSYAGFIGTVTAMNEKGLAVGEMGGRGEGDWDGLPMSFLLRKIMEEASTVEEALEIMKNTPRTCEYYYVLSDRSRNMAGIYATQKEFKVLKPGEQCPGKLPFVPEETIMISARERADILSKRLQEKYGQLDAELLKEIIKRPVAMKSNLHNVIFEPETLDLHVSDANKKTMACDNKYVKFNLIELLDSYGKIKQTK